MSEDAKNLLLRLKKEKKINKQIDLIQKLRDHNQEDIVNSVLLKHLENKDHDTLRLEILAALNYEVLQKKEASVATNTNRLTFMQGSVVYLNQRTFEPFIELINEGAKIDIAPQKPTGGTDI